MKCASCGDAIKGDPLWVDDLPYCCEECADMGPIEEDEAEEKEKEGEEEEEKEIEETW